MYQFWIAVDIDRVKTQFKIMDTEHKDNTRGIAIGGLTTGIIGTALSLVKNGGLGNLFGIGCGTDTMRLFRKSVMTIWNSLRRCMRTD